jgi:hypothetical protein
MHNYTVKVKLHSGGVLNVHVAAENLQAAKTRALKSVGGKVVVSASKD